MICINCGKKIDDDSKFCMYCGKSFTSYGQNLKSGNIISETKNTSKVNYSTQNKKPLSKGLIALIVIAALFLFGGFSTCINSITNKTTYPKNISDTTVKEAVNENISKTTTTPTTIIESVIIEDGTIFNLSIANGTGTAGLAKKTAEIFKEIKYPSGKDKYKITHITNADKYDYEDTLIVCKSEDPILEKAAQDIEATLGVGNIKVSNEVLKDTDIAIIIGQDYIPTIETTAEKTVTYFEYDVIYTLKGYRFDGANKYFLLINPINLSDESFKDGIKTTIRRFVERNGNKVTIDIYDDINILKSDYEHDKNLDIITDQEYLKKQERHLIAGYDGDLSTGLYLNALWFFPAYGGYSDEIGKLAETIEFNPN